MPFGTPPAVIVAGLPAEGYEIDIRDAGIEVRAADTAGAFYAEQTLRQLARLHDGRLPVGHIRDWPDLAHRGVMLDVSRDKVPTMTTLLALVDRLAEWKVNHLELYAEHTFAYRGHEVVWQAASPFTADRDRRRSTPTAGIDTSRSSRTRTASAT